MASCSRTARRWTPSPSARRYPDLFPLLISRGMTRVIGRAGRRGYAGHMRIRYRPSDAMAGAAGLFLIALLFVVSCQREPALEVDSHAAAAPAAAAPVAASAESGPGGWFVKTGCVKCHSVSVYDLKSETNIGPDLAIAAEDVKAR